MSIRALTSSGHPHRAGARRFVLLGLLALLACSTAVTAAAAPTVAARQAKSVQGSWSATGGEVVDQRQVGSLVYLHQRGTSAFSGDLVGTTTFDLHVVLRADFSSLGVATETFTGRVGDRSGTLLMVERATGAADGSVRIDAAVVGGTGALRGVTGTITFVSPLCIPETCDGTYSGSLRG